METIGIQTEEQGKAKERSGERGKQIKRDGSKAKNKPKSRKES